MLALLLESGLSRITAYASLRCLPVPATPPANAGKTFPFRRKQDASTDPFFDDTWYVVELHQTSLHESSQTNVRNRQLLPVYSDVR
jgi:hypothetical protein